MYRPTRNTITRGPNCEKIRPRACLGFVHGETAGRNFPSVGRYCRGAFRGRAKYLLNNRARILHCPNISAMARHVIENDRNPQRSFHTNFRRVSGEWTRTRNIIFGQLRWSSIITIGRRRRPESFCRAQRFVTAVFTLQTLIELSFQFDPTASSAARSTCALRIRAIYGSSDRWPAILHCRATTRTT